MYQWFNKYHQSSDKYYELDHLFNSLCCLKWSYGRSTICSLYITCLDVRSFCFYMSKSSRDCSYLQHVNEQFSVWQFFFHYLNWVIIYVIIYVSNTLQKNIYHMRLKFICFQGLSIIYLVVYVDRPLLTYWLYHGKQKSSAIVWLYCVLFRPQC